ncbi:hypothetical protein EGW08_009934 [Elysia chlorotica]|uniref:Carboxylesterase type B domain-containing protein n=1 Tax=Elysia chlorotica TaxID=188477 RepID=A0A433TL58_ELYCH|nr:hypothetical protein EGW08_009934 [Elysia chlorotica]
MASFHKSKLMPIGVFILLTSLVIVGVVVAVFIKPLEKLSSSKEAVSNGNQPEQKNSYVTVSTKYGDVRGLTYRVTHEESIEVFLGVPFAKPPVGELRFSRPQPVSPWKPEVKDATRYGNMCVQQRTRIYNLTTASEDCLYLNIYSPRQSSPRSKRSSNTSLPVMLYVHGGSFRNGDSIYFNYTNLALKGVVVVTTNYRLDGLGFLSTQDDVIPGNFGLLDTGLALEFVKEIIGNFRGNPSQITMFGASAGLSPCHHGNQRSRTRHATGTCVSSSVLGSTT